MMLNIQEYVSLRLDLALQNESKCNNFSLEKIMNKHYIMFWNVAVASDFDIACIFFNKFQLQSITAV